MGFKIWIIFLIVTLSQGNSDILHSNSTGGGKVAKWQSISPPNKFPKISHSFIPSAYFNRTKVLKNVTTTTSPPASTFPSNQGNSSDARRQVSRSRFVAPYVRRRQDNWPDYDFYDTFDPGDTVGPDYYQEPDYYQPRYRPRSTLYPEGYHKVVTWKKPNRFDEFYPDEFYPEDPVPEHRKNHYPPSWYSDSSPATRYRPKLKVTRSTTHPMIQSAENVNQDDPDPTHSSKLNRFKFKDRKYPGRSASSISDSVARYGRKPMMRMRVHVYPDGEEVGQKWRSSQYDNHEMLGHKWHYSNAYYSKDTPHHYPMNENDKWYRDVQQWTRGHHYNNDNGHGKNRNWVSRLRQANDMVLHLHLHDDEQRHGGFRY